MTIRSDMTEARELTIVNVFARIRAVLVEADEA